MGVRIRLELGSYTYIGCINDRSLENNDMITIESKYAAENIIKNGDEEIRMMVQPNFINKFSLYLTGKTKNGVEIFGVGPMWVRGYWSLWEYANLVSLALEKGYRVFIKKDGNMFSEGEWYIECRLK